VAKRRDGKFEEIGLISGFAYDLHGEEHGNMGPDCGDYDNDGFLDIYLTSYAKQLPFYTGILAMGLSRMLRRRPEQARALFRT